MTGNIILKTTWGPFSSQYLGISHILDDQSGAKADMPIYIGRKNPSTIMLPDSAFDYIQSGTDGDRRATVTALPEDVATDYSAFSLRYFIDRHGDTALARFKVESDHLARCEVTFQNASNEEREYFYGLGITASDDSKKVLLKESLRPWWLAAKNYHSIQAYQKTFALGCRQCLTRIYLWGIEDEVLAQAFGGWAEDCVSYNVHLPDSLQDGFLYFRYIKYGDLNPAWELRLNGKPIPFHFPQTWAIPGGGWGKNRDSYEYWRLLRVSIGCLPAGENKLELRCLEAPGNDMARIWLDGMLFHEGLLPGDAGEVSPTSLIDQELRAKAFVRKAPDATDSFEVVLSDQAPRRVKISMESEPASAECGTGSFVAHLRQRMHLPQARLLCDPTVSPWGAMESANVTVAPKSERTISFTICWDGDAEDATKRESTPIPAPLEQPYSELAARVADVLLFNVNYPLRLFGKPSPYFVPAKYFPIPYSWDGGLAAVGLATIDPALALQQATYFMADEEYEFPMIYCGSPVPTPLYALWDWYQATQDLDGLAKAYKGAKRMYDFYLGRTPGSLVNHQSEGFLSTYAYNYNLGIDDHPIQRWAEECHLTSKGLYSLILMPQILRLAGIMRNIAILLGHKADAEQFRKDAALLTGNIESRMWDEESGLYGWARRTELGVEPVIFQGCAGDRSACTFLPLFAGLTAHKDRLITQMMDPKRFNTPFGISSVDILAPSYNPQGYWNGGIWPVLQWFLWRGLLEAGEPKLARQVAERILTTWQHFLKTEHYLGEHFMIAQEQMNGAPNFGGLSAVLLPMRAAYFAPYQVTTLYDVVILKKSVDCTEDAITLTLGAPCLTSDTHDLLINMGCGMTNYSVILNGQPHSEFVSDETGHLWLRLPRPKGHQEVTVRPSRKGSY